MVVRGEVVDTTPGTQLVHRELCREKPVTDGIPDSVRDVVALSLTHNQIHRFVDRAASSGGGGCKCDQKGGSQYGDSEERRAVSGCVIPSPVGYADLVSYAAKTLPTH